MSKVDVPQHLMSYQEAADTLGITLQSLRTAVAEHRLHSVKIPGTQYKYIRREEIADYRQRVRTTEAQPGDLVPQAQATAEQMRAAARAVAEPVASMYRNMAQDAASAIIAAAVSGLQVQQGRQPTLDPKVLAV